MAEDRIDSYVDLEATGQETKAFLDQLNAVYDLYKNIKNTKINLKSSDNFSETTKKTNELSAAMKEYERVGKQLEATATRLATQETQKAKALIITREELRKNTAELKNQNREQSAAEGSIEKLRATLIRLNKEYDNLSKTQRDVLGGQELKNQINGISTELKKLEGDTGRFQRNVGNYSSAFNGLGNSINQITRELPSFANSVQTGFLAISNNLPIFFDAISQTKREIAGLRAEGKETQGLLGRLASSFFSFGTILSLGVTALTIYGKDLVNFISALIKGKDALDAFAEKQKLIGEAFKDSGVKEAVANVAQVGTAFELAAKGVITKEAALKDYNDKLGEVIGNADTLEEAEKLYADNTGRYVQATILRAAASKALDKVVEATLRLAETKNKSEKEFSNLTDFALTNTGTNAEVNARLFKEQEQSRRQLARARREDAKLEAIIERNQLKKVYDDLIKDAAKASEGLKGFGLFGDGKSGGGSHEAIKAINKKFFDDELKDLSDTYKKASEIESLYFNTRAGLRKKAFDLDLQIVKGHQVTELENEKAKLNSILNSKKSSDTDKLNAQNEYNEKEKEINQKAAGERIVATRDFEADILKIKGESLKKQAEAEKEAAKLSEELFKEQSDSKLAAIAAETKQRTDALEEGKNAELEGLNRRFQDSIKAAKGNQEKIKKAEEAFTAERLEIERKYAISVLEVEIEMAEKIIALRKALGFDTGAAEKALSSLKIQLSNLETETVLANNKRQTQSEKEKIAGIQKGLEALNIIYGKVSGLMSSLTTNMTTEEKNKIQTVIDGIEIKKKAEIDAINASALSQQEKADKIAVIEAQANAKKEEQQRKQRKLDIQKAEIDKAIGLGQIIINTALAIVKSLPNIPLAVAVGVLGAAEFAIAAAAPIPKFKRGRQGGPATMAIVGDGGVPEVITEADGSNPVITPAHDTYAHLQENAKVFPNIHEYLNAILYKSIKAPGQVNVLDTGNTDIRVVGALRRIENAIVNKRETYFHWDNGELRTSVKNGAGWDHYVNTNIYK